MTYLSTARALRRPGRPAPEARRPFGARFVAPLALGSALNPINSTMISTALAPIAEDYHASVAQTGWLIAGLYLASAIAQPMMGRLADLFGPRRIYLASLVGIALAGAAGALSHSFAALVWVRVLLGVGTSGAYPSAMRLFRVQADRTGAEPPRFALSVLSFAGAATLAVGPLLGGLLTSAFGWHAIFAVNLPLAAVIIPMVLVWTPRDAVSVTDLRSALRSLDLTGAALLAGLLLTLMAFLMGLRRPSWPALLAAAAFGAMLYRHALRRSDPFIDVKMLVANRPLAATYGRAIVLFLVLYCVLYGFAQWLEASVGLDSTRAGLVTLPMSLVAAATSLLGGNKLGVRQAFIVCAGMLLVGCLGLAAFSQHAPLWAMTAALVVFGVPMGLGSTATQAAVFAQAPHAQIGAAAGLQRTATYIGAISSSSLLGLVYGARASDAGLHHLAWIMAALSAACVAAILSDRTLPRRQPAAAGR